MNDFLEAFSNKMGPFRIYIEYWEFILELVDFFFLS